MCQTFSLDPGLLNTKTLVISELITEYSLINPQAHVTDANVTLPYAI